MKGDFSRGHAPDFARRLPEDIDPQDSSRHEYRRVLMQQGRLLLDSDFNAAVDALLTSDRKVVRALGCDAGSADLGFLVTPGRLLGVWRTDEGAEVLSGSANLWLDHRYKYLGRYPGFYIGNLSEPSPTGPGDGSSPDGSSPEGTVSPDGTTSPAGDKSPADSPPVESPGLESPDSSPPSFVSPDATFSPDSPDSPALSSPDADSPAASSPDTGSPDTGSPDTGSPDTGSPASGSPSATSPTATSPDDSGIPTGLPTTVRLPLRQAFDSEVSTRIALWVRVDGSGTLAIEVNGVALSILGPTAGYERYTVEFALASDGSADLLEITVPAGGALWVGLVEQDQAAGDYPLFWSAEGAYLVDGLIVDNGADGPFPTLSFPEWAGFWPSGGADSPESPASPASADAEIPVDGLVFNTGLKSGDLVVAFLEVWEHHLTWRMDSGLIEQALGGDTDTTTRARLLGQVKVASAALTGDLDTILGQVRGVFTREPATQPGLTVVAAEDAAEASDPCELPETSGYSGTDNRLYRFEVHEGGDVRDLLLKWSRDNGSELFEASLDASENLVFDSDVDLSEGDLVEVLSDVTEFGDDVLASITSSAFQPPTRSTGQLAALKAVESTGSSDTILFRLVDPDDSQQSVSLDGRYGALGEGSTLRVRRWHGTLRPFDEDLAEGGPYDIEDGIQITLANTGTWLPGQYWQYQARVNADNANGPWRTAPHGPERLFAPLALFQYESAEQPLTLLAWLDTRFPPPCGILADDVAFDGARVGSEAATVQEALEELFEQEIEIPDQGCGEIVVTPEDDIQEAVDRIASAEDARICFHPGKWKLSGTVVVNAKGNVTLVGVAGGTIIEAPDIERAFHFQNCGSVRMSGLIVSAGQVYESDDLNGAISFEGVAQVDLDHCQIRCGSAWARHASAILVRASATTGKDEITRAPSVRISDCRVDVGHMQTGVLLNDVSYVSVERCQIVGEEGELDFASWAAHPGLHAAIGNVLINRIATEDLSASTSSPPGTTAPGIPLTTATSSEALAFSAYRNRTRAIIEELPNWGNPALYTFDTDPELVGSDGTSTTTTVDADGNLVTTTLYPDGTVVSTTTDPDGNFLSATTTYPDGTTTTTTTPTTSSTTGTSTGVSSFWLDVLQANPPDGAAVASLTWKTAHLRKLGRRIARYLLGSADPHYNIVLSEEQIVAFKQVLTRLETENSALTGGQGIVVGTRRTPKLGRGEAHKRAAGSGGEARLAGAPLEPDIHILNNRIEGFIQGIHLGASHNPSRRGARYRLYRVRVQGNTVLLRVPSFAGERHGIFVGNAHSVTVRDNQVELTFPEPGDWKDWKPIDGVRLWGTYGQMVLVRDNNCQGVYSGVRVNPLNKESIGLSGASWKISDNAYFGWGSAEVLPS